MASKIDFSITSLKKVCSTASKTTIKYSQEKFYPDKWIIFVKQYILKSNFYFYIEKTSIFEK